MYLAQSDCFQLRHPGLFLSISFFLNTNFTEKTVGVSRISTWIVGVEGKHADHLTTTTTTVQIGLLSSNHSHPGGY